MVPSVKGAMLYLLNIVSSIVYRLISTSEFFFFFRISASSCPSTLSTNISFTKLGGSVRLKIIQLYCVEHN